MSLKIDFYESGKGETILITFPDDSVGIVDAHPSPRSGSRPSIVQLVDGRKIRFVCLTHAHLDHGKDLVPLVKSDQVIPEFWSSLSDVLTVLYALDQGANFRSPLAEAAREYDLQWRKFLIELYHALYVERCGQTLRRDVHDGLEAIQIAGTNIYFLGPSVEMRNRVTDSIVAVLRDERKQGLDPNLASIVLAIEFHGQVVLLGADALKQNWQEILPKYRKAGLPKAAVLKVPHHGASNAMELRKGKSSYLDLCTSQTVTVLFAGDKKHPDSRVQDLLGRKTKLHCLINGLSGGPTKSSPNPLGIMLPGARPVDSEIEPCQERITLTLKAQNAVSVSYGHGCDVCSRATAST